MGWTTTHVPKGKAGEYLRDLFHTDNDTVKMELVQGAFRSFKEYYAAVRTTIKATGESYVWACVVLVNYYPHDYHNFGYKDMDETMGPYSYNCPVSILKLLTPTEQIKTHIGGSAYKNSKQWRVASWERALNAEATAKMKDGTIIEFENALHFRGGDSVKKFVMRKRGKAMRFYKHNENTNGYYSYQSYRLRKRDLGNFKVVGMARLAA